MESYRCKLVAYLFLTLGVMVGRVSSDSELNVANSQVSVWEDIISVCAPAGSLTADNAQCSRWVKR